MRIWLLSGAALCDLRDALGPFSNFLNEKIEFGVSNRKVAHIVFWGWPPPLFSLLLLFYLFLSLFCGHHHAPAAAIHA